MMRLYLSLIYTVYSTVIMLVSSIRISLTVCCGRLNVNDYIQSPTHRALALNATLQSMVLLKNDNFFLPLQKQYNTMAVSSVLIRTAHILHDVYYVYQ